MEFKEAKKIIRTELILASVEKLAEVLDAARAGNMRWGNCSGFCFASVMVGQLIEVGSEAWNPVSDAYAFLGRCPGESFFSPASEDRRQRVLTHMALAEIRHRMRLADITEVSSISELMTGVRE